jgi:hypothetical protein
MRRRVREAAIGIRRMGGSSGGKRYSYAESGRTARLTTGPPRRSITAVLAPSAHGDRSGCRLPRAPRPSCFGDGVVSTAGFRDASPPFTPDGKTLYFVKSTRAFHGLEDLGDRSGRKAAGRHPKMAPFSGTYRDADPT